MTILLADGFELGTSLAEANTMSGNVITSTANASSTFTYGASSSGQGRSLTIAMFPTTTSGSASGGAVTSPVSGFLGASGAVGYKFTMSFKAKLNANKVAIISVFGMNNSAINGSYFRLSTASALSTLPVTLSLDVGTATVGSFTSPSDYNLHTYTMTATKTAANVWSVQVYLDTIQVINLTGVSAALVDAMVMYWAYSNGAALTSQTNMFSEIDDFYLSDTSPLGIVTIRHIAGSSDIQAQFTKVGSAGSNYASVDNISLTTGNSLTAAGTAEDIYGTNTALGTGRRVVAACATVIASGASSDNIAAKASSGGNSITSGPIALGAVDARISTGWVPLAISGGDLTTLRYGQAKT